MVMVTLSEMALPSSGLSMLHEYDSDDSTFEAEDEEEVKGGATLSIKTDKSSKRLSSCTGVSHVSEPTSKRPRMLNDNEECCTTTRHCKQHDLSSYTSKTETPDNNDNTTQSEVLLPLPRVPADILNMFADIKEGGPEEDPSQHEGRVRSFPHVRGNWASYIYIHCPEDTAAIMELNQIICKSGNLKPCEQSVNLLDDKHLSLSRTLPFRHHWIEPFTESLKNVIGSCQKFELCFDQFEVYTNDEKSRTFISMKTIGTTPLIDVVEKCDASLADFQLEPYYKDPSFHVSCAWMLGDQTCWVKQNLLPSLNEKWSKSIEKESDLQFFPVTSVAFKTGNRLFNFFLQE